MSAREILRDQPTPLPKGSPRIVYSTERMARSLAGYASSNIAEKADREQRERERRQMTAYVANQPHRQGQAGEDAGTPLRRFCLRTWPGRERESHRHLMRAAGEAYDQIVRDELVARGLPYIGQAGGLGGASEDELDEMTEDERRKHIQAMQDNVWALSEKLKRANEAARSVSEKAPRILRSVCYEHNEPGPYDAGILGNSLYRIADHLGMIDHGINALD